MSVKTVKAPVAKPILKWAGGKTQMLGELCLFFSMKNDSFITAGHDSFQK